MANSGVVAINPADVAPSFQLSTTTSLRPSWEPTVSFPPSAILVGVAAIPDAQVSVVTPFVVVIEPLGAHYIATSPISLAYEVGDTRAGALRSYLDTLVEHFAWLTEEEPRLAPTIQSELAQLRRFLRA